VTAPADELRAAFLDSWIETTAITTIVERSAGLFRREV
jgi:hypothetical protein